MISFNWSDKTKGEPMNNDIISLLDFNPEEIELIKTETDIETNTKYIHVQKILNPTYCPICHCRMHSRGIKVRTINHPIFQDGSRLVIKLHQRRWKCKNALCSVSELNDEFSFVQKNHRNTNMVPYLILNRLKDIRVTAVSAAKAFDVSDTYVHQTVLRYLDCDRLELPEILCVDEVYLKFDYKNTFALVLMNFRTGEIVDMLPNRRYLTYDKYFKSIPKAERDGVRVLICDMYNPYINMTNKYFRNAVCVIDSFHVIQWINREISKYIIQIKKKYQERDYKQLKEENNHSNRQKKSKKQSDEVYLLNNHSYILLSNKDHIKYSQEKYYDYHFQYHVDTYDIEKMFLDLDENFRKIRFFKEMYIDFNNKYPRDMSDISKDLDTLIYTYKNSGLNMFVEFSRLLTKNKQEILNSFIDIRPIDNGICDESLKATQSAYRRLSNGPMEGFNRDPKDLKRNSRGVSDIEYTIKRILWSNRKNQPIRAIPRPKEEIIESHKKNKKE